MLRSGFRLTAHVGMKASGMKVFSHQAAAYEELLIRAQTFFAGHWRQLPIKTRWHSLVIGPTGSGKTTLAAMLAAAVDAEPLRIGAPSWIPSGAHNRACAETLTVIADHVSTHQRTLLFVDELEKLHFDTSWNSYIFCELYDILDGRWPAGIRGGESSTLQVDGEGTLTLSQRNTLTEKMMASTFILAAATFQDFYEERSARSIGFHGDAEVQGVSLGPTYDTLTKKLPRELLNRFHSTHVLLPELSPVHYQQIAEEAEKTLPQWIQSAFHEAAAIRMKHAIAAKAGCRFVEEALMDALKCTKTPSPDVPECEPDPWDW